MPCNIRHPDRREAFIYELARRSVKQREFYSPSLFFFCELRSRPSLLSFTSDVPLDHSLGSPTLHQLRVVECVWNLMAHGDAREGRWRGNWRMECVASTLTLPRNVVYPALLTLMRTPRLSAVDWTDALADLNGLVLFGEGRNLDSARVPSRFKHSLPFMNIAVSRQMAWSIWSCTLTGSVQGRAFIELSCE